jgi:hypothetical protein
MGAMGTIVGGPTTASGYTWWKIDYDSSCDGWSLQNYLTTALAESAAPFAQTATAGDVASQYDALILQLQEALAQLQALLETRGQ